MRAATASGAHGAALERRATVHTGLKVMLMALYVALPLAADYGALRLWDGAGERFGAGRARGERRKTW